MLKPSLDYIRASKPLNLAFWITVTVFLGALGSGLWETVVSPVFTFAGRQLIQLLSQISQAYSDSLHSRIGLDGVQSLGRLPHSLAFFASILAPWSLYLASDLLVTRASRHLPAGNESATKVSLEDIQGQLKKTHDLSVHLRRFCFWFAILCGLFSFHASNQASYSYTASRYVERAIDILAPSLTEVERLTFRAKYRAVETADDFARLYDALNSSAAKHDVKLPKFTPILRTKKG